jgi:hypothetical protein
LGRPRQPPPTAHRRRNDPLFRQANYASDSNLKKIAFHRAGLFPDAVAIRV